MSNGIRTTVDGVEYEALSGHNNVRVGDMLFAQSDGTLVPFSPLAIGCRMLGIFRPVPVYYIAGGVAWVETGEVRPVNPREAFLDVNNVALRHDIRLLSSWPILRPHHIVEEDSNGSR